MDLNKAFFALIPIYIFYIVALGFLMFRQRYGAIKTGKVDPKYFKSYQMEAPRELETMKNHFSNQFEIPTLFFITCLSAMMINAVSMVLVVLGYLFIFSRLVHSYIHLGTNKVPQRAMSFFAGILILVGMWISIFITI